MRCLSSADYYRIGANVYLRLSPFGAKNLKIIFPKCSTIYKLSNNHIFIGIFSADEFLLESQFSASGKSYTWVKNKIYECLVVLNLPPSTMVFRWVLQSYTSDDTLLVFGLFISITAGAKLATFPIKYGSTINSGVRTFLCSTTNWFVNWECWKVYICGQWKGHITIANWLEGNIYSNLDEVRRG